MNDSSHVAIGRFEDGKVFAFNFLTGTELTLEEADSWENGEDLTTCGLRGSVYRELLRKLVRNQQFRISGIREPHDELKQRKTWKS